MAGQKVGDAYVEISARFDKLDKQMEKMNGRMKKNLKKTESSLSTAFTRLGGVIGGAFALDKIMAFTKQAVELAGVAEGVSSAFDKLNDPKLLDDLRKATRGTISDLQLMKAAVRANNFKVPLSKLATFFEFATKRSAETGESVDYLVNSIVDGIGRKSTLVMDNLGISAAELQAEIKKTGDFGLAAGNLIEKGLGQMGEVAETSAQKTQQLNAQLENTTILVGEKLTPAWNGFKLAAVDTLDALNTTLDKNVSGLTKFVLWAAKASNNAGLLAWANAKIAIEQHEGKMTTDALARSQQALNDGVKAGLWGAEQAVIVGGELNDNQQILLRYFHDQILAYRSKNTEQETSNQLTEEEIALMKKNNAEWTKYLTKYGAAMGAKGLPDLTTDLSGKGIQSAGIQDSNEGLAETNQQLTDVSNNAAIASEAMSAFGMAFSGSMNESQSAMFDFISTLIQFVLRVIAANQAAATSAAIAGGTQSGAGTGPAAAFTTPAFVAGLVALVGSAFAAIPKFARGGQHRGGMAMVGERGAELVNLPNGSDIIPNHRLGAYGNSLSSSDSIEVFGMVRGQNIYFSNNRANRINQRTTG